MPDVAVFAASRRVHEATEDESREVLPDGTPYDTRAPLGMRKATSTETTSTTNTRGQTLSHTVPSRDRFANSRDLWGVAPAGFIGLNYHVGHSSLADHASEHSSVHGKGMRVRWTGTELICGRDIGHDRVNQHDIGTATHADVFKERTMKLTIPNNTQRLLEEETLPYCTRRWMHM